MCQTNFYNDVINEFRDIALDLQESRCVISRLELKLIVQVSKELSIREAHEVAARDNLLVFVKRLGVQFIWVSSSESYVKVKCTHMSK